MNDLDASTSQPPTEHAPAAGHYAELTASLDRVRWALKRAAAVRGLAVVILEGVGLVLIFALLDYLYVMPQSVRIGALAVVAAVVGVLLVRHVVRELLRVIPDERVALYLEERQPGADGALLSATAFGKTGAQERGAVYGSIVAHIVASAAQKTEGLQVSRVLDLARLRKYVLAAVVVLFFCAISAIRLSSARVHRLLMPWQASREDLSVAASISDIKAPLAFKIALDATDHRVARGSALRVKATLSAAPSGPVQVKFRTAGSPQFKSLAMEEIDELDTYALRIPDISEDLEFFLQCDGQISKTVAVAVFDPLELKGYQVTVTPPAYAGGKPSVEFGRSADVSALAGSKVTLRAVANTPLAGGEVTFGDGARLPLAAESGTEHAATAEFTVDKDATFTIAIASVDRQESGPSATFTVHAIADEPPTVSVTAPRSDQAAHPSAEVAFTVRAGDDVGLDHVDLVYNAGHGDVSEHRLPFPLTEADRGPGDHDVALLFRLGDLKERFKAGDTLFYHIEAGDRKGQKRLSDIYLLGIRPYEIAGAFSIGAPHEAHRHHASLMVFIAAVWNVRVQKDQVDADAYAKLCDELHARMIDEHGAPIRFTKPKPAGLTPDKVALLEHGDALVIAGIAALAAHDADTSVADLRQALALYQSVGVGSDFLEHSEILERGGQGGGGEDPMADALGFLHMDRPTPTFDAPPPGETPDFHRSLKRDEAKRLRDEARQLEQRQQQIQAQVQQLALAAGEAHPAPPAGAQAQAHAENAAAAGAADQHPPHPAGATAADDANHVANVDERRNELGRQQQDLADQAARLAQDLAQHAPNPDRDARDVLEHFRQTRDQMAAAADAIREGSFQQAAAHGEEARRELAQAEGNLDASQVADLQHAIETAEDRAQQIFERQQRIHDAAAQVLADAGRRDPQAAEPALNAHEAEQIRGLAAMQVENQRATENLQAFVQQAERLAETSDRKDAADGLRQAARTMEQNKIAETMVTSAVNLAQHEFTDATAAQDALANALGRLNHELQAANGAMAQTREQRLRRADAELTDIIAQAAELGGIPAAGAHPDPAAGEHPGPAADAHPDPAAGAHAEPAAGAQPDPTAVAHHDPGAGAHPDPAAGDHAGPGEPAQAHPMTADDRHRAESDLQRRTARVAKRIADDHLADAAVLAQLTAAAGDERSFHEVFSKEPGKPDESGKKLGAFIGTLKTASAHLEGKLESALKAKRLSAAQREQTPASYRAMVNEYYEQLAKE